jgi:hypothetical protein
MTDIDRIADRRRRIAAAGIVAIVSVAIAAAAHAVAGGGTPSIVALMLAVLVGGTVGLGIVGARLTRARAAVGVVVDQAVLNALFTFFGASPTAATTSASTGDAHAAHSMATPDLAQVATANPALSMLMMHLGAALVAYGMLRHGLAAIDAIATALVTALARALDPAVAVAPFVSTPLLTPSDVDRPAIAAELVRLPGQRGPPALAAR